MTGSTTKNSSFETVSATGGYNALLHTACDDVQGVHPGAAVLGQDVLHVAARPALGRRNPIPDPTKLSTTDPTKDIYGNYLCDWRRRFFGTNDNTKLWNSSRAMAVADGRRLHDQLQRHPGLDRELRVQPVPARPPRRPHPVLHGHPDQHRHLVVPADQHRPAVLEGIHRQLPGIQQTGSQLLVVRQRSGRIRRRFHLGHVADLVPADAAAGRRT